MKRGLALLLAVPLSGCALVGTMPDRPPLGASACAEYRAEVRYVRDLEDTYRSRGGWNRGAIYIGAGIVLVGLSVVTAGAATVAAGTLALLGIATGTAGGLFAITDNSTLASVYTMAANDVTILAAESEAFLKPDVVTGNRYQNQPACAAALTALRVGTAKIRVLLEAARTDSTLAALIRAQSQQQEQGRVLRGISE